MSRTRQWDEMYPTSTPIEDKIKLLLVMRGYKKGDLHFRNTLEKERYLRYDYWESIDGRDIGYVETIENIQIEEFSFFDEDCGWKFGYNYKEARSLIK